MISRPRRKSQIILAVAACLIMVGYLRETGHIGLNLYSARNSASSTTSVASVTSASAPTPRSAGAMGQPAASIVETHGDPRLVQYVRDAIAGIPGAKPPAHIVVKRLTTRGSYWVPIYKTGVCSYDIRLSDGDPNAAVASGDANGVHYMGTLSGEIDEKVTGVCSVYHFQELVGQEVGKQVRAALEKYESAPDNGK
ncbi:MAG: hypothetical protein ABIY70_01205 [Capsulimonas sp.]|uniref:hypothetical protein n=1 Tax=Capsulimonas sp. TaxID=2494211 RepID=UPI00326360FB